MLTEKQVKNIKINDITFDNAKVIKCVNEGDFITLIFQRGDIKTVGNFKKTDTILIQHNINDFEPF